MKLSNISGNPHEAVVVIADDLDQPGNVLISRLPLAESVPSSDVIDYDEAGAKQAAKEAAPADPKDAEIADLQAKLAAATANEAATPDTAAQAPVGAPSGGDTGQ